MPARKRHRREPEHPDPVVRFARAVKETEAREKSERLRKEAEKREAAERRRLAEEYAAKLKIARRELERAIDGAKAARASGKGITEADEKWRLAKAKLIELETGAPPRWADTGRSDSSDTDATTGATDDGTAENAADGEVGSIDAPDNVT